MTQAICDLLAQRSGVGIEWHASEVGDSFAVVPSRQWLEVCRQARNEEDLFFDFLRAQTGVDYPDDESIEIVLHLFSYKHRHSLVLKTRVNRIEPKLETVCGVWPAANWYEREIWDLLGVYFVGHPDLRRLVLPQDWVGHPLRKDYQEADNYRGIPTTRPGYAKAEPKPAKKATAAVAAKKPAADNKKSGTEKASGENS